MDEQKAQQNIDNRGRADVAKAIKILDGLRDCLEVAMIGEEYTEFTKALQYLRRSQTTLYVVKPLNDSNKR